MKKENISHKNIQDVVIYNDANVKVSLRADVTKETIWATQAQIAELFGTKRPAITKHFANIFKTKELNRKAVCSILEHTANDGKKYKTQFYNLDAVIAIGYRVNSKKATAFRIWATKTLKEYIIKGIVINDDRIKKLADKHMFDLGKKIHFIQETIRKRELDQTEVQGLLSVIDSYASSWSLLQKYDEGGLVVPKGLLKSKKKFEYDFVRNAIDELAKRLVSKGEAGDLFGNERDGAFKGIILGIYQSFGGNEVYRSIEEKAAHLLYFIIKDHPFSDGNKRIGSFLLLPKVIQKRKIQ